MSDIETGRDSMKYLKKVIILQILFVVIIGAVNVQAAYNKCPTGRYIPYKTKIIKVDLNKDGKKETVKVECHGDYGTDCSLYINKKLVIKNCGLIWITDIDTRDHYIEIIELGSEDPILKIYRYNGKKLTKYASAKRADTFQDAMKKNYIYAETTGRIETTGKGKIVIYSSVDVHADNDHSGELGSSVENGFCYTVKKNSIKLDQSVICKVTDENRGTGIRKIMKKWVIYKYPRLNSNRKVFTVNKGDKVKIMNFKFTQKYTYMKLQKLKTKQTGWVIFRTKDLDKQYY